MSTTTTPIRVTITRVDPEPAEIERLGDFTMNLTRIPELDRLFDDMPDGFTEPTCTGAFEDEVIRAAEAEVVEQLRDLIVAAIAKRLPWTWEGEELYR